jgi:hypothetical protein
MMADRCSSNQFGVNVFSLLTSPARQLVISVNVVKLVIVFFGHYLRRSPHLHAPVFAPADWPC